MNSLELLLSSPEYDDETMTQEWSWELHEQLTLDLQNEVASEIADCFPSCTAKSVDIGRAADWPCVLVSLTAGLALALALVRSGKDINDGIEGWQSLIEKFNSWMRSRRARLVRLDELSMISLELEAIFRCEENAAEAGLQLISSLTTIGHRVTRGNEGILDESPDALYHHVWRVGAESCYVFTSKSTGEFLCARRLSLYWGGFDDQSDEVLVGLDHSIAETKTPPE